MFFSVIVPIYNIEKYLSRCIDSVLSQTFADFELILVDDGSPDNCPKICDEYAENDHRIKVIHKENGGLVSARQAGIGVAKGDYIFNLDGDDAITTDALMSAYEIISDTKAEMVSFSYRIYTNDKLGEVVDDLAEEGLYDKKRLAEQIYPNILSNKNMHNLFYFLWGKAIKKDLVLKHQLNVNPAISLGEDLSCMVPCYLEAQSVYMSKKAIYLYTIRNDSISTDFKTHQVSQIADVITGLRGLNIEKPNDFDQQISRYSCFMCFAILAAAAEGNHFNAIKKLKELILGSLHREEIKKAHFEKITTKSRIAIYLMKKQRIRLAFYFLYLCKELKHMRKGDKK
jgi:glycosyltransferase involved in cell wall biosynthesis